MFGTTSFFEGVPCGVVVDGVERLHEVVAFQSSCTSLCDLTLGKNAGTLLDLRIEFDQAWDRVCCTG